MSSGYNKELRQYFEVRGRNKSIDGYGINFPLKIMGYNNNIPVLMGYSNEILKIRLVGYRRSTIYNFNSLFLLGNNHFGVTGITEQLLNDLLNYAYIPIYIDYKKFKFIIGKGILGIVEGSDIKIIYLETINKSFFQNDAFTENDVSYYFDKSILLEEGDPKLLKAIKPLILNKLKSVPENQIFIKSNLSDFIKDSFPKRNIIDLNDDQNTKKAALLNFISTLAA